MEIGLFPCKCIHFLKWTGLAFSPTEAFKKLLPILESRPIALATSDTSAPVASQIALMALMLEIRCARKALAAYRERSTWFQYRTLTNIFSSWSLWPLLIYAKNPPTYTFVMFDSLLHLLRVDSWFYCSCQLKRQAASLCNWLDCYLAWANLSFGRGTAKLCRKCGGDALKFLLEPLVLNFVAAVKNFLNGTGPTYVGSLFKHTLYALRGEGLILELPNFNQGYLNSALNNPAQSCVYCNSYIVPACYT